MYADEDAQHFCSSANRPRRFSKQAPPAAAGYQFQFRAQREKIDWKKLASIDVDQIVSDVDVSLLQSNLTNVTFCDLQSEIGPSLDPGFLKLFRLAQLTIEYLLHSQECLSSALSRNEQQRSKLKQKLHSKQLGKSGKHVILRSNRGKASTAPLFVTDFANGHQCVHCEKQFLNNIYLDMHLLRRHPDRLATSGDAPEADNSKTELIKELRELKDQLVSSRLAHSISFATKDVGSELQLKDVKDVLFKGFQSLEDESNVVKRTEVSIPEQKSDLTDTRRISEEATLSLLLQNQKEEMEQLKLQMSNLKAGMKQKSIDPVAHHVAQSFSEGIHNDPHEASKKYVGVQPLWSN